MKEDLRDIVEGYHCQSLSVDAEWECKAVEKLKLHWLEHLKTVLKLRNLDQKINSQPHI